MPPALDAAFDAAASSTPGVGPPPFPPVDAAAVLLVAGLAGSLLAIAAAKWAPPHGGASGGHAPWHARHTAWEAAVAGLAAGTVDVASFQATTARLLAAEAPGGRPTPAGATRRLAASAVPRLRAEKALLLAALGGGMTREEAGQRLDALRGAYRARAAAWGLPLGEESDEEVGGGAVLKGGGVKGYGAMDVADGELADTEGNTLASE